MRATQPLFQEYEGNEFQDVWHSGGVRLDLTKISQSWLRQAVKQFIRYSLATKSLATVQARLLGMKRFSRFLAQRYPSIQPPKIDRSLVIDFISYLSKFSESTKAGNLSHLKTFFETCVRENWLSISSKPLIYPEDFPRKRKKKPRYIPEDVIERLQTALAQEDDQFRRMVIVLKDCGMRVSELVNLPFDCLTQDNQGSWFLRYYQPKMKKEHVIPISNELAHLIQEQQEIVKTQFDSPPDHLFLRKLKGGKFHPTGTPITTDAFRKKIRQFAQKHNICDSLGEPWHFQPHQFRHTVGTRMINRGVPQHIVQRYLGHESPTMTAVYAHIHDETLKKEIEKFYGKVVNIAGEVIESEHPELDSDPDLQWLKRKVLGEVLPNGYCGLPVTQTCSKGNACLTCGDFRTTLEFLDQHKEHRERTKKVLDKAKANNWQRQIQVNEDVLKSLDNIINALEADNE